MVLRSFQFCGSTQWWVKFHLDQQAWGPVEHFWSSVIDGPYLKRKFLFRSPDLLLLDEATSALDTATERNIQAALQEVWWTFVLSCSSLGFRFARTGPVLLWHIGSAPSSMPTRFGINSVLIEFSPDSGVRPRWSCWIGHPPRVAGEGRGVRGHVESANKRREWRGGWKNRIFGGRKGKNNVCGRQT